MDWIREAGTNVFPEGAESFPGFIAQWLQAFGLQIKGIGVHEKVSDRQVRRRVTW